MSRSMQRRRRIPLMALVAPHNSVRFPVDPPLGPSEQPVVRSEFANDLSLQMNTPYELEITNHGDRPVPFMIEFWPKIVAQLATSPVVGDGLREVGNILGRVLGEAFRGLFRRR